MKRKKKVMSARVRPGSHEGFKGAVQAKWGKIHGVFGDELSDAMDAFVGNHLSHPVRTRTHVDIADRGLKIVERVFARLRDHREIIDRTLDAAIRAEAGTDPRTIRKYRDLLIRQLGWLEVKFKGDFGRVGIYRIARKSLKARGGS